MRRKKTFWIFQKPTVCLETLEALEILENLEDLEDLETLEALESIIKSRLPWSGKPAWLIEYECAERRLNY